MMVSPEAPTVAGLGEISTDAGGPVTTTTSAKPVNWFNVAVTERRRGQRCHQPCRGDRKARSEEHTSELQSPCNLVCRLLLEKKKKKQYRTRKQNCTIC